MAFIGGTYKVGFPGKFTGTENVDEVAPGDMIDGSRNIDSHNGGYEKRGGTQTLHTAISGIPRCLGGFQSIQGNGTKVRYFAGDDGKIYRNQTSVKTGWNTSAKVHFAQMGDSTFIANGVNVPQVDTGSAIADITTSAADWTSSNQPAVFVLHSRGLARRAWAVNVTGFKRSAYYSSLGAFQTFSGGTSGAVNVDIQKGGIVTAAEFGENLMFFGKEETFILQDDDVDVATWGVYRAGWTGGVYSPRLLVKAANDIFCMMEDGEIYSVARASEVRDYKLASITRPHFIHNWIKNNIDLSKIADFHCAYDPKIQAIRFFMVRIGQTRADVCLKYYVFEGVWGAPDDGYDNDNGESGFIASASWQENNGVGDDRCVTGDYLGVSWVLSDDDKDDNGNAYTGKVSLGWNPVELPRETKRFVRALLNYLARGAYIVSVRWYLDGNAQTTSTVDVGGVGGAYGSATYGTSVYAVIGIEESEINLGNIGRKLRFDIENDGAGEDFFLSFLLIDFVRMGAKVK